MERGLRDKSTGELLPLRPFRVALALYIRATMEAESVILRHDPSGGLLHERRALITRLMCRIPPNQRAEVMHFGQHRERVTS